MLRTAALVIGLLLTLSGLAGVGIYVAGLIDIVATRPPDRSWIFWGLGFAGLGGTSLIAGIALLVVWRQLSKTKDPPYGPIEPPG